MLSTIKLGRLGDYRATTLVAVGLLGLVLALQFRSGAYESEFGAHPDEAAHVVTGLMVHDYLVGRDWMTPMRFAENFYVHYPKVALGHWPPVFYMVQASWMLFFGASRIALLLLMAGTCTSLAMVVYRVVRRNLGMPLAVAAAAVFVVLPVVQMSTADIMTENLVALFAFAATIAFARYLEAGRPYRWSLAFATLASLAIMTKGSGILLALLPPFCLLFARRLDCLGRPSLWLSAGIVATACLPFYLMTLEMQRNGMQHESFRASFVPIAAQFYGTSLVNIATVGAFSLAMIGVADRIIMPLWRKTGAQPIFAAMGGLLISVWGFHVVVPCGLEPRHLLPALPPLVLFMAAGMHWIGRQIGRTSHRATLTVELLAGVLVILHVLTGVSPYHKAWRGYGECIRDLVRKGDESSVLMISSDSSGEGMMVSEGALSDRHRPSRYVLRASKMLAKDRWSGGQYQKHFDSPARIDEFLEKTRVGVLLIDTSIDPENAPEHHRQLLSMVRMFPARWRLQSNYDITRNGTLHHGGICSYHLEGLDPDAPLEIEIDMEMMLGRPIRAGVRKGGGGPDLSPLRTRPVAAAPDRSTATLGGPVR